MPANPGDTVIDVGRTWLVTGATGMLGQDMVACLHTLGEGVRPFGSADLDITDAAAVDDVVGDAASGGDVVVANLAAWTDVDGAESHEDDAYAVNADGARHVARSCARYGARMIHVSTDYVFDGTATTPYAEDTPHNPVNAYGRTKAAGEQAVLAELPDAVIMRTAWLYGEHGKNFVHTMIRLATEREVLDVVDDQTGQPTWTADLAGRIVEVADIPGARGVFHTTNSGATTWFGLARAIFAEAGLDPARVRPATTDQFPRPAPRPAYSVLGHDHWTDIGLTAMRPWCAALAAAVPVIIGKESGIYGSAFRSTARRYDSSA